jgi:hypothetical protein
LGRELRRHQARVAGRIAVRARRASLLFSAFQAIFFIQRPRVPLLFFVSFGLATFLAQFAPVFWPLKLGMPAASP